MTNNNQPSLTKKPATRRLIIKEKNSNYKPTVNNNTRIVTMGAPLPDSEIKKHLENGIYFI